MNRRLAVVIVASFFIAFAWMLLQCDQKPHRITGVTSKPSSRADTALGGGSASSTLQIQSSSTAWHFPSPANVAADLPHVARITFALREDTAKEDESLVLAPDSLQDPEIANMEDPQWQTMRADLIDWQPVFDQDWNCRQRFASFGDSTSACTYTRTSVVERIGANEGRIRYVTARVGPESEDVPGCAAYVRCQAKIWLGLIVHLPPDAMAPHAWVETGIIPPKGTLPEDLAGIDKLIEDYRDGLVYWREQAQLSPAQGFRVLYLEDMLGTWEMYREKFIEDN